MNNVRQTYAHKEVRTTGLTHTHVETLLSVFRRTIKNSRKLKATTSPRMNPRQKRNPSLARRGSNKVVAVVVDQVLYQVMTWRHTKREEEEVTMHLVLIFRLLEEIKPSNASSLAPTAS